MTDMKLNTDAKSAYVLRQAADIVERLPWYNAETIAQRMREAALSQSTSTAPDADVIEGLRSENAQLHARIASLEAELQNQLEVANVNQGLAEGRAESAFEQGYIKGTVNGHKKAQKAFRTAIGMAS